MAGGCSHNRSGRFGGLRERMNNDSFRHGFTGIDKYRSRESDDQVDCLKIPDLTLKEPLGKTAGIILIVLGISALLFPVVFFTILDKFIAILAFIIGIGFIREGVILNKEKALSRILLVVSGILGLCIGILILVTQRILMFTVKDIIGIWAIITGIGYIISVFSSVSGPDRGFKSVSGLILGFFGVILLIAPVLLTDYILVVILGLFAIGFGILTIMFASDKPKAKKEANHLIYK